MERYVEHTASRDSGLERQGNTIQDRIRRFNDIRANNPHLQRYMTGDPVDAGGVLGRVGRILAQNPQVIEDLNAVHSDSDNPDQITMAILPDFNLVVAKEGNQTWALVATLSCTFNAIDDLFKDKPKARGQYDIFISPNGLIDKAWEMATSEAKKNSKAVLTYNRKSVKPEDYVALAAQGVFYNEVFRQRLAPR